MGSSLARGTYEYRQSLLADGQAVFLENLSFSSLFLSLTRLKMSEILMDLKEKKTCTYNPVLSDNIKQYIFWLFRQVVLIAA